jgi:PBP1b-binding outer membrane lipoprotein LpoB
MIKKLSVSMFVILLFGGCSYKMNYKSNFNKNTSINNEYVISGNIENSIDQGAFSSTIRNKVILYINNKLVVKTALNKDFSGRTELFYNSKLLILECGKDSIFSKPKCIIQLDGENLGTLNFDYNPNM